MDEHTRIMYGVCRPGDVEVAITPEEMEGLDEAGMRALYEQKVRSVCVCVCVDGDGREMHPGHQATASLKSLQGHVVALQVRGAGSHTSRWSYVSPPTLWRLAVDIQGNPPQPEQSP